jgi:protein-S-isoprenylcysteine O-methyltransferase Ste14
VGDGDTGRGAGWVWGQFAVMGAVVGLGFVPPHWPHWPHWPPGAYGVLASLATVLAVAGGGIAVWASRKLGRGFTPFPRPLPAGELVESGPYRMVRHPVYAGGLLFFLGYSLYASVPALAATAVLAVVWALKARVEEGYLRKRYPAYEEYAERVRFRIVPFVY